ncbi:SnoaL-like domain-containing protein [Pricia antarctica]|uniref:SnoaL-like domain-containing protein n=1 Tax=Pricia antarctica TaxID=641691 RepID=A0A1G7HA22_9FLAO|nr:nuclear transport factor 2 family protein [Pricia antarctica]SDE97235.1 SnoaL-like domain-containing protein [Pricia antarctica]
MNYKEKAKDIYYQLQQDKLLDAFDQYYGNDIIMTEPRGTRTGKAECRQYEEQFLASIGEFHSLEIVNLASDVEEGVTFIESVMDVTFKGGQRAKMEQVAVQRWKGDHIVHERFYYNTEQ